MARVTIENIKLLTAAHYNMNVREFVSQRRARAVARPRQVAMYLCTVYAYHSLPQIGRRFGGRDHTTVMHARAQVMKLMRSDDATAEAVAKISSQLDACAAEKPSIEQLLEDIDAHLEGYRLLLVRLALEAPEQVPELFALPFRKEKQCLRAS